MSAKTTNPNLWSARIHLWDLQKELLQTLKAEFDQKAGRETTPAEWFQALTLSPEYAWIKDYTTLMAEIDVCTELESISAQDESAARQAIEDLLFDGKSKAFYASYFTVLQKGMDLLPLHNQMKKALSLLPKSEMTDEEIKTLRASWHSRHRSQAKSKRN